jgi:hypothetical protein
MALAELVAPCARGAIVFCDSWGPVDDARKIPDGRIEHVLAVSGKCELVWMYKSQV